MAKDHQSYKTVKPVIFWLFSCAAMVFAMALIGAVTRLTGSGLSITVWDPILGALPPLNTTDWQAAFQLYKDTPEFAATNSWMELADFKKIYFWEWLHRLWGRLIGLAYALPLIYFWLRKQLPKDNTGMFILILVLGGAQGFMGWYMVQSGLVDQPAVSHYRLAGHLLLGFIIFGLLFRLALKLWLIPEHTARLAALGGQGKRVLVLLLLTITWGAFTAGLDAGMIYNEFPMMGKNFWPEELFAGKSLWHNILNNPATVQFTHRVLAVLTVFYIFSFCLASRYYNPEGRAEKLFWVLALVALVQAGLGIATLLTQLSLPLAVAHQAGALAVFAVLIWLLHEIPHKSLAYSS